MTLPPPPGCNVALADRVMVRFLAEESRRAGFDRGVLGLSGGIDSALVVKLAARALDPQQVYAICMPYRASDPLSLQLARDSAEDAGVHFEVCDISDAADAMFAESGDLEDLTDPAVRLRRGNLLARLRMVTLYDRSAKLHALVLGTSNKTELLLGYGTQHGDMASAINPIGDLYKAQVVALSRHLKVPQAIVNRPPTADLWEGQTDEDELGFSYDAVDALLHRMVDRRHSHETLIEEGFPESFIELVNLRVRRNQYKRRPPLIAKLANRTINLDYRYARDSWT